VARISAQLGERQGGRAEESIEECLLLGAHESAKLGWERKDNVVVARREEERSLPREPAERLRAAARRTSAMTARVEQDVLRATVATLSEATPERGSAAIENATERGRVAREEIRMRADVGRPVPRGDVAQT
jgi:hypothetical protein